MDEKELLELAKKFGDNYTYGKIVGVLKEKFIDKKIVEKDIDKSIEDEGYEDSDVIIVLKGLKKGWGLE